MDTGIGLTEIDKWDLQDIEYMQLVVEVKTAHTDAHSKFKEDENDKASNKKNK